MKPICSCQYILGLKGQVALLRLSAVWMFFRLDVKNVLLDCSNQLGKEHGK